MSLKNKVILFRASFPRKFSYMQKNHFNDQKRKLLQTETSRDKARLKKEYQNMETRRDKDQKKSVCRQDFAAPKSLFFNFILKKEITSFSYQCTISTTESHGLQHYCLQNQINSYRPCRLWIMSRLIWTIFLVRKRLQLPYY